MFLRREPCGSLRVNIFYVLLTAYCAPQRQSPLNPVHHYQTILQLALTQILIMVISTWTWLVIIVPSNLYWFIILTCGSSTSWPNMSSDYSSFAGSFSCAFQLGHFRLCVNRVVKKQLLWLLLNPLDSRVCRQICQNKIKEGRETAVEA